MEEFLGALSDAWLKNAREHNILDEERYAILKRVSEVFKDVFGEKYEAKIELSPGFSSGDVCVRVPKMEVSHEQLEYIASNLRECSTFAVDPLVTGEIDVSCTVNFVLKGKDSEK